MEQNDSSGWKIAVQDLKKPWKELGGGSFGMVVAGTYLGTSVAIKCVGYNLNVEDNQLFEREVKTLMCSSHPSIIRCIGVSFDADKVRSRALPFVPCLPFEAGLFSYRVGGRQRFVKAVKGKPATEHTAKVIPSTTSCTGNGVLAQRER